MCQFAGLALAVSLATGCATSGYVVRLSARCGGCDGALLKRFEEKAATSGFTVDYERRRNRSFPELVSSGYHKVLPSDGSGRGDHDRMTIGLSCWTDQKSLTASVESRYRGNDPVVRREIDELGDYLYSEVMKLDVCEDLTIRREAISGVFPM